MRLKLFQKFFLAISLIVLFSISVMTVLLSFFLNQYLTRSKFDSLEKCCREVSDYTGNASGEEIRSQKTVQILSALSAVSDTDIFIADADGKIFACACEDWEKNGHCDHSDHILTEKELSVSEKDSGKIETLGIYQKARYVCRAVLTDSEGNACGTVFTTAPASATKELLSAITKLYFFSAAIPLILMFFAIYAMTYRLTKPLKQMSEATRLMAKGDFSKRIPVMSDDEIGELAISFNQMTNSLARLESMRKSFVANVSHELKTPMTTIGGFIDGILDGTIEPERQKEYLAIVSDEVKRLSRLVESMLSMSKLESGEFAIRPELFDFRELLCTIVISQEQRIEAKKIQIAGLDTIDSISVYADRDLIHQVIYNLVDNAVKFTDEGGTISFRAERDAKNVRFSIRNTGKGIPEKELPFVFERFYKVDKSRSSNKNSTGLGLYIVKTIVKAHGGGITVKSKENVETEFSVTLPTAAKQKGN